MVAEEEGNGDLLQMEKSASPGHVESGGQNGVQISGLGNWEVGGTLTEPEIIAGEKGGQFNIEHVV